MPATLLLSDALADQLEHAVESGVPIETACEAAGISARQFYEWLRGAESGRWSTGDPISESTKAIISAFSLRIRRAQAKHESAVLQRISAASEAVNEKTGIPEWRAGAWLLNNHPRYRERYRPQRETIVTNQGTVLHEHQLAKQLEPDALEAAYQALHQLPDAST